MKHIDIRLVTSDENYIEKDVTVCGWVRTSRDSKNMAFIELNDGTTLKHLQIVIEKSVFEHIDNAFTFFALVEFLIGYQRFFNIVIRQENTRMSCIFAKDNVHAFEGFNRAVCYFLYVANGRCYDV